MAPKQRTWNYGNLSNKKKKKPIPVSKENIQMASGEYLMDSPLNYMARIGADYGTAIPRIVQTPTDWPGKEGMYYPSRNRSFEAPINQAEAEFFEKAKGLSGASVTDTKSMAGRSERWWLEGGTRRTYGKKYYTKPLRSEIEGTGYKATSRPRDVIGLVPHSPAKDTSVRRQIGYQPRDYGGIRSYESEDLEGRGYLGDSKIIYEPRQIKEEQKYKSAISQLDTLDHELQHRGFAKWRAIVWQDEALRERLENKYGRDHPVLKILLSDDHPYIYYQSTDPWSKKHRGKITRQVKEMVDQEILPYFFKRIPSLKDADSLQGPAYGDVKGRGTIMTKRDRESRTKYKGSYAVKSNGKRNWNY